MPPGTTATCGPRYWRWTWRRSGATTCSTARWVAAISTRCYRRVARSRRRRWCANSSAAIHRRPPSSPRSPASAGKSQPRRHASRIQLMSAYLLRRLWQMIPTMLGVVLLVFFLFNYVGGDPAYILAGKISSPEQIASIRKQLGIDEPFHIQLWIFIKQILTADFGSSWATNEPVSQIIATRIGPSLTVLVPMMIVETILSVLIAVGVAY